MPPRVASIIFAIGIAGLFYIDRDAKTRLSKALWIPAVWLFLIGSRYVSVWLGMAPTDMTAYSEGSPIDRAVFMVLLFAGLGVILNRIDRVSALLMKNVPILLFLFFCLLSILWSDFPLVAFKRWSKAIGDVVIVLIILTEPDPMSALRRLITRLGFLFFPLSILFIKYYPELGRVLTQGWVHEAVGVAMQKNSLGEICSIYGLGFVWCLRSVYRDR